MSKNVISSSILILITIIFIGIIVVVFLKLNQPARKTVQKNNSYTPNLLTQDHEFQNTKFNYKLRYSDIFEITTPNPEVSASVNFRKKDDNKKEESGITIKVIESNSALKDVCGTQFLISKGIYCNKDEFKFMPVLDSLPWQIYEENLIEIEPSGYIYASFFSNGKIYLITNYGYQAIESNVIMNNIILTE